MKASLVYPIKIKLDTEEAEDIWKFLDKTKSFIDSYSIVADFKEELRKVLGKSIYE